MPRTAPSNPESRPPPSAKVFTLGRFHVEVDGQPLRFGHKAQRRPLELLKLLIALGGDSIPVEKVTDSLWPDSDGDQAQGAFDTTLHRLRKLIGHDALRLADSRITLDPGQCRVDSQEFQESLSQASRAVEEQDGEGAWGHVEDALALYRGPFLEGEFEPVEILAARERLHGLFLRHIQQLSEFYLRTGQHAKAIVLYQRGLEVDELAEEFYQGLMRCQGAMGHLGEVVSLYQRCREVLRASAEIDPSPETEAVYQALISEQREGNRAPAEAAASAAEPGGEPAAPGQAPARVGRATGPLKRIRRKAALGVAALAVVALSAGFGGWIYLAPPGEGSERSCLDDVGVLTLPEEPSIAVLAFDNLSGDPEQEYFSDALTENIITQLAKIKGIFVIARHSSFKYKGKAVTPQQVGRELGVRYVLEGSVQRNVETIRITVQLIDAANGKHLWAEKYDGELKGAFDFQDAIVRRIAFAIDTSLVEGDLPPSYGPKNPEAFDLAAKALRHFLRHRKEDNKIAQKLLKQAQAVALDPNYWDVLQGWIHFDEARYGWSASRSESRELARRLAMRKISRDENHPGAYGLLAYILVLDRDFQKAIAMGERSLALVPNNAHNLQRMAFLLEYGGRPEEAIGYVCKAMRLNPFFPVFYWGTLGDSYRLAGKYDQAIAAFQKVLERKPDDVRLGRIRLTAAFIQAGREAEGREVARQILKLKPKFSLKRYEKSRLYKNKAETKRLIDALREAGLPD